MELYGKEWQWLMSKTHLILEDANDLSFELGDIYGVITREDLSDPQVFDMYSMIYPALTTFQGAADSLLSRVHSHGGFDSHYITTQIYVEKGNYRWDSL